MTLIYIVCKLATLYLYNSTVWPTIHTPQEKVAVVTGGSTGMGYETSLMLARNGFHTYATMRKLEGGGSNQMSTILSLYASKDRHLTTKILVLRAGDFVSVVLIICFVRFILFCYSPYYIRSACLLLCRLLLSLMLVVLFLLHLLDPCCLVSLELKLQYASQLLVLPVLSVLLI